MMMMMMMMLHVSSSQSLRMGLKVQYSKVSLRESWCCDFGVLIHLHKSEERNNKALCFVH